MPKQYQDEPSFPVQRWKTQIVTSRSRLYRGEGKPEEEEKQQDEEEVEMGGGQEVGLFLP